MGREGCTQAPSLRVIRSLPIGLGEYAHERLRSCAEDPECRAGLDGLLDTRWTNDQLKASPWPQLTVLVTAAKILPIGARQIWWAYKQRYAE